MLWECRCCREQIDDNPHAHSDYGGEIIVYGPRCEACDQNMELVDTTSGDE